MQIFNDTANMQYACNNFIEILITIYKYIMPENDDNSKIIMNIKSWPYYF